MNKENIKPAGNGQRSILIIDDHPLFREGLKSIIAEDPHYTVIGEAGTFNGGLEMIKKCCPDLTTVDIHLPDGDGLDLAWKIQELNQNTLILMISMYTDKDRITEALKMGVNGYISKGSAQNCVMECLNAIFAGKKYLDPSITETTIQTLIGNFSKHPVSNNVYDHLTLRERKILRMIVNGFEVEDIADALSVSIKTVKNCRTNVMNKLKIHNPFELIKYAIKIGLIDSESLKS